MWGPVSRHGEDLLHGGHPGLDDGIGLEDPDDRAVEQGEVAQEGDELPELKPWWRITTTDSQRKERPEAGEEFGGGAHEGVAPLDPVVVVVVGLNAPAEDVLFLLLGGEGAHDPIVGDPLVEEADDPRPVAAMATAFMPHPAAMPEIVEDEKRDEDNRKRAIFQLRKKRRIKTPMAMVRSPMRETDAPVTSVCTERGILGDAGDDATGLAFLVKFQGEFLEMGEDGDAQIAGDVHAGRLHEVIAGEQGGGRAERSSPKRMSRGKMAGHPVAVFGTRRSRSHAIFCGMIPIEQIDDPTGERGEDKREERDEENKEENAGGLRGL